MNQDSTQPYSRTQNFIKAVTSSEADFHKRIVPELPEKGQRLPLLIDSDVANEIDDVYAIALVLCSEDRFDIKGFVATHYANWAGPESTQISYDVLLELLKAADCGGRYPVTKGGHPMQYCGYPSDSEGVDLIIEEARKACPENPLWIVVLGASTNTASALLKAPEIRKNVRVVFHARCGWLWPERTVQFNVTGDGIAAQSLLDYAIPLVWFDTGTKLNLTMKDSEERIASSGKLGQFLHAYRNRSPVFALETKGFFDIADIAWMIDADLCRQEVVDVPRLKREFTFEHTGQRGQMRRVTKVKVPETWEMFFERIANPVRAEQVSL